MREGGRKSGGGGVAIGEERGGERQSNEQGEEKRG